MAQRRLDLLVKGGSFFEGPRWRDGHWYISDFYRHSVFKIDPAGKESVVMQVAEQPSGLGWLPDGSLLVSAMLNKRLLRRKPNGEVSIHADVSALCGGPINDMVVDANGNAYVGNFGFDMMAGEQPRGANLIRVDAGGGVSLAASDLQFPNGTVITPDGRTLIIGETMGARYTAFDIAPNGVLSNKRIWAALEGVAPDGCCLDAEGRIWCSDPRGGRVLRIAEGGAILEEITIPGGQSTYACMLGGEDGRTLLIACGASFSAGLDGIEKRRDAVLYTTRVEVPHAGCP